jgi:ribulose-phosphate 3-epimerase
MKEAGEYLPEVGRLSYDIDLMVGQPERDLALWTHLGATRLTLHVESVPDIARLLGELRHRHGHRQTAGEGMLQIGLAISIKTDLSLIEPHLEHVDYVQVMGIAHIGSQGQPFDEQAIRRVKALKRYAPKLLVQVDGGVDLETAPRLLSVGADRLIVGHAIVKAPDIVAAYEKFDRIVREYSGSVLG